MFFNRNGSAIDTRAGKNTHARAHTAATLAQVTRYAFKHNGSAIDTRAGKNTHALVLARSFANRFE